MAGIETKTVSDSFLNRTLNSDDASITEKTPSLLKKYIFPSAKIGDTQ